MWFFTNVAVFQFAVHIVAIGLVGRRQIFLD
jgi:hypothetical protein